MSEFRQRLRARHAEQVAQEEAFLEQFRGTVAGFKARLNASLDKLEVAMAEGCRRQLECVDRLEALVSKTKPDRKKRPR